MKNANRSGKYFRESKTAPYSTIFFSVFNKIITGGNKTTFGRLSGSKLNATPLKRKIRKE